MRDVLGSKRPAIRGLPTACPGARLLPVAVAGFTHRPPTCCPQVIHSISCRVFLATLNQSLYLVSGPGWKTQHLAVSRVLERMEESKFGLWSRLSYGRNTNELQEIERVRAA